MASPTYQVELAEGAEQDLEGIFNYLAAHRSVEDAAALLDGLLKTIESLEAFPFRGSVPKEFDVLGIREFRQMLHGHYRLIYHVDDTKVVILMIADGRRDMRTLLERRLLGH